MERLEEAQRSHASLAARRCSRPTIGSPPSRRPATCRRPRSTPSWRRCWRSGLRRSPGCPRTCSPSTTGSVSRRVASVPPRCGPASAAAAGSPWTPRSWPGPRSLDGRGAPLRGVPADPGPHLGERALGARGPHHAGAGAARGHRPPTGRRFSGGLAGSDPGLSDEGRAQVRSVGEWLAPLADRIDAIVSSPVRRTRESADVLAPLLGREVAEEPDFAEMDFGAWDGLTFDEVTERHRDDLDAWIGSVDVAPGVTGESLRSVEQRVLAARDRCLAEHAGRTVVVVSHVTPIKTLVAAAMEAPLASLHRLELAPASVSVLGNWPADGEHGLGLGADAQRMPTPTARGWEADAVAARDTRTRCTEGWSRSRGDRCRRGRGRGGPRGPLRHHLRPRGRPRRAGCRRGRLGPSSTAQPRSRSASARRPGYAGRRPSSSRARTIRPLVALLKWLTTLRCASASCSTRTVATRGAARRRPPERRRTAWSAGRPAGRGPAPRSTAGPSASRQRAATGPRPGSVVSPESRYAGIRSVGPDQPEQPRVPATRVSARRRAAGERVASAERVVQHAGVDPSARRSAPERSRRCASTRSRWVPPRPRTPLPRPGRRAQLDQGVEHRLGVAVSEWGRAGRRSSGGRAAGGLALARRQQDQHGANVRVLPWRAVESSRSGPCGSGRGGLVDELRRGGSSGSRRSWRSTPDFPDAVEQAARPRRPPPGSPRSTAPTSSCSRSTRRRRRDLDQALHLERDGDGYVVHYAIADVAAFVSAGDPVDARGAPPRRDPLRRRRQGAAPPDRDLRGGRVAAAGPGRPALLWTIRVDRTGEGTDVTVERALVRSPRAAGLRDAQRQVDDGSAPSSLMLLREVGELRLEREAARGGVSLPLPEQEVDIDGESRGPGVPLDAAGRAVERPGLAAHRLRGRGADGLRPGRAAPRTLPPPDPRDVQRLHRTARALGIDWPAEQLYPDFIRTLDPERPATPRWSSPAPGCCAAAATSPSTARCPPSRSTPRSPPSTPTSPPRCAGSGDRYTGEVCLALCAGAEVPDWVRAGCPASPARCSSPRQRREALRAGRPRPRRGRRAPRPGR